MMNDLAPNRRYHVVVALLLGAAAFACAYGQAPLYYSNQNQYFLHGLAAAGKGLLREDWLANTADPTPIFSALVAETARWLPLAAFHVYHGLLTAVYALALVALFARYAGPETAARRWPVFLALLMLVHAAAGRWLSQRLFGLDYPWYFQSGVAGQYLLGAMFQPSVFGVLLLVALALFVWERPYSAAVCCAAGATIHTTYLLPAGLLTAGFLTALLFEGQVRRAAAVGTLALVLVLPITVSVVLRFGPTSPETFAEAQAILVNVRIPHHARPDLWLDPIAALQIAWLTLGIALTWRTRLFPVLVVPFALAAVLTLVQVLTGNDTLALLFPWRVSAVLMPAATAVIMARLVLIGALPLDGAAAWTASALVITALAVVGVWISVGRLAFASDDAELPLYDFVRTTGAPGDVYLLPVPDPERLKPARGSLSSDFKPPAEKRSDNRVIPPGLQRFRLTAEAPIYVDFKSIPYRDAEVVEWRDRLFATRDLYQRLRAGPRAEALAELRRRGITHVIAPTTLDLAGPGLEPIGPVDDPTYRVYRVTGT